MLIVTCLTALVFAVGWLGVLLRRGPVAATSRSGCVMADTVLDIVRMSSRRILALAWLAVRESIRRRVVIVFVVFLVLLLFAGWYLNPTSDQPARLYIQFVLTTTSYLTLFLAWILSSLSLPGDIKDHTIYTIVTKPVRKTEIVLGRWLGFAIVGTVLLAAMCAVSYVFTVRGLNHTHELTPAMLHEQSSADVTVEKGLTSIVQHHQHDVTVNRSGVVIVEPKNGHWHDVTVEGSGANAIYKLGPPQGSLIARVPIYGKLQFRKRSGKPDERGINVGDEWSYRSFIEGATPAAAIWTFNGITEKVFPEKMFPDGLPVEMTLEVFRSHKGDIERPIWGSLSLRNPDTGRTVKVRDFLAKKFATDVQWIPRQLVDRHGDREPETLDLFRDLVTKDGRVEIWIQCLEGGQYFGMAQPDLYLRAGDASFLGNFIKGYAGIWLQMMIVLAVGIMFSTFVGGPVAMIATLGIALAGLFSTYMLDLALGNIYGGGPFQSFIRIVNQQNLVQDLEPGLQTNVALMSDWVIQWLLSALSSVLPSFDDLNFVDHVAYGFNIDGALLLKGLFRTGAFLLPALVLSYLFLKSREVAK